MSVYFIRAEGTPFVKIGWAINPLKRVRELQCGSPAQLVIVRSAAGAPSAERAAHRDFADYRVKGEWFRYIDEMLSWEPPAIVADRSNGRPVANVACAARPIPSRDDFLAEIEAFLAERKVEPSTFGREALKDPGFVFGLRAGRNPTLDTVERVREFMAGSTEPTINAAQGAVA